MGISAMVPKDGIVAEIGGRSRPLVLTIGGVERFEEKNKPLGMFEVMAQMLGSGYPTASVCLDLVAFGLVGGGLSDQEADSIVSGVQPSDLIQIRSIAQQVLFCAFVSDGDKKKDTDEALKAKEKPSKPSTPKAYSRTQPS